MQTFIHPLFDQFRLYSKGLDLVLLGFSMVGYVFM